MDEIQRQKGQSDQRQFYEDQIKSLLSIIKEKDSHICALEEHIASMQTEEEVLTYREKMAAQ